MSTSAVVEAQKGENLRLEVRRVIRASRERIFEAWTRPEQIQKWFGPPNVIMVAAQADVVEGGHYNIQTTVGPSGPGESEEIRRAGVTGEYLNVIPNLLLRFTWRADWSPGAETIVTVQLQDVEGGTEVIVKQERFTDDVWRSRHEQGWTGALDKMAAYLENH
jgi:uncharacterized protein YndB with AHSA1/START domain